MPGVVGPHGAGHSRPGHGARNRSDVSGRPLPAVMLVISVQPLNAAPLQPRSSAPPLTPTPDAVLRLQRQQMALVEIGRTALARSGPASSARSRCYPVPGRPAPRRRSISNRCTARSPSCRCAGGGAAESGRSRASSCRSTSGTHIPRGRTDRGCRHPPGTYSAGSPVLARVPLMPMYVAVTTIAAGRSRCADDLPVLRVADAEIRVDGEGVGRNPGRHVEAVGQRQRIERTVCTLRLFESGDCCAICIAIVL